ncbi:MAG: Alcohol dehydrogenase, partial [uncultured Rubrobacteraceae bacterium]
DHHPFRPSRRGRRPVRHRRDRAARARTGPRPRDGRGVRRLPLGLDVRQRRRPRCDVPADLRPRDRRAHRRGRRRRRGLGRRRAGVRRLVRRQLRLLPGLPRGRLHPLRAPPDPRLGLPGRLRRGHGRPRLRAGANPGRVHRRRCGAHGLRGRDRVQRAQAQPGRAGRPRRGSRPGWSRPPGRAVRQQDGLRDRGNLARGRQGGRSQEARRPPLRRQHRRRRGRAAAGPGRREGRAGHREQLRRDGRHHRRAAPQRRAPRRRGRAGAHPGQPVPDPHDQQDRARPPVRHRARRRRDPALRGANRGPAHDRGASPGRGRRGLRPHDVRRCPLPHGPHHRQV